MGACSQGALSKLLVEPGASPHTFDASSEMYDFLRENIAKHGRIVGARGITGSRSQSISRTRLGAYAVGGRLSMYTCSADFENWLPRILGGAGPGTFNVAESINTFGILIDRVGDNDGTDTAFEYQDCVVNRAIIKGLATPADAEPELVEMTLEILAKEEVCDKAWPGSPPTLSTAANRAPYIMADGVLTIGGAAYEFHQFVLAIDNHVEPRWVNSLTATALCPQDRSVVLRVKTPFTSVEYQGLYADMIADNLSGVAANLKFTNNAGDTSTDFVFDDLQWAAQSPSVIGKTEIPLYIDFICRLDTGATSEIAVTNDSTV